MILGFPLPIDLIQRFYKASDARHQWPQEIARRADGKTVRITSDFFFHMNPLYEPNLAMQYVVGRYEAAFDALARLKPKSVLEIGCAHGLSTWLMTSFAERVTGLDISPERIAVAQAFFPEVEWVCGDFAGYLASEGGRQFDVIVNSHGPVYSSPEIERASVHYIYIGYRAPDWRTAITGAHKLKGRQLSFSTTLQGPGQHGRDPKYLSYYVRRNWLKEARHALGNGYALPL